MLRIKLVRSIIAQNPRNVATVQALGLKKVGSVVEKEDTPSIRGMIHKIQHMVMVEAPEGSAPIVDASQPGSSSRLLGSHHKKISPRKANETHRHGEEK